MRKCIFFILILLMTVSQAALSHGQLYSAQKVLAFTRIVSVTASPSGKQVAFVTRKRCQKNPSRYCYLLRLKEGQGRFSKISQADFMSSVAWSPHGKSLAFIARQGHKNILFLYKLMNQAVVPIVSSSRSIDALKWSPSGEHIAFVADQLPTKKVIDSDMLKQVNARMNNARLYLISHIKAHASFRPMTSSAWRISVSLLGGGFDWSPDGLKLAYSFQPDRRSNSDKRSQIAILNLTTGRSTVLTYCRKHVCQSPMYSPNGQWLAFAANIDARGKKKALLEDIEIHSHICVMNNQGKVHCLRNTFNQSPHLIGWASNSQSVYVADIFKTKGPEIYEINIQRQIPNRLISKQKNYIEPMTISLNDSHKIFGFGAESVNKAPEVFLADARHFKLISQTHFNSKFSHSLGKVQLLHWHSSDGVKIEGLLITPQNYRSAKHYPLYVDVHGGPNSVQARRYLGGCNEYTEAIPPTTCMANILSLGYVILQVNYRGSNGYGLHFRVKNFRDLGGGAYKDIMSGIDYLQRFNFINPHKIVIAGWSWGGYMSAWAIAHSHRFYKAIDGDGVTNFVSYTGISDDTDFFARYLGAYYWQHKVYQLYWDRSPIAYVQHIKTPLLIIQGAEDIRVPPEQSRELYTALYLLHRPVKMLLAVHQAHEPDNPVTITHEIQAVDQWLR